MAHLAYVNGRYRPHSEASVHVEDRGYQFSDGIYEYLAFYHRRLLDLDLHLGRLERSLRELDIVMPMSRAALMIVIDELIARSDRTHGGLYIQITRGVARRDHVFPKQGKPSLVMTLCAAKFPKPHEIQDGVRVMTHPDQRWERRDIKTVSLLANVLAKQAAARAGAREAWLVENGVITEGAVSNAYIVSAAGELITHPADHHILPGITRDVVLALARAQGIPVIERPYTPEEAHAAAEAFLTSTSANVLPVVRINDRSVGSGKPGPITRALARAYEQHITQQTGYVFS